MTTPAKALLNAAGRGNLERLKELELLVNAEEFRRLCETVKGQDGRKALHYAAEGGYTRVCEYLIEKVKVDANMLTEEGDTAFVRALMSNQLPSASYLLKQGADANKRTHKGATPLHYSAYKGYVNFMQELIAKGADINSSCNYESPLASAASLGQKEAVRILLDHNANPNPISPLSMSPLMLSILAESYECLNMLIQAGADPNVMFSGFTPLVYAASLNDTGYMKLLLKAGADPNVFDLAGMSPLEHAILVSNIEGVEILFPLTSRDPSVPDWSIRGVIDHFQSYEGKEERMIKATENFLLAKKRGEAAIKKKDYVDAIRCYNEADFIFPCDPKILSNRSLCWAYLNDGARALIDAKACVKLKPDWAKAHYREGVAWTLQKKYSMASEAFSEALHLEPGNKEIQKAFNEAVGAEFGFEASATGVEVSAPLADNTKVLRFKY